jgi:hypothetical protein
MKALKTIVATAVIVFALTTVAMAGVQHLSGPAGDATQAGAAAQAAAQPVAQSAGGVTLSERQFAALLGAVRHDAAQDRSRDRSHAKDQDRTQKHDRQQARTHAQDAHTGSAGSSTTTTASHHTTTTHHTTHHTDGGAQSGGTHDGGTHDGGHDGGCD